MRIGIDIDNVISNFNEALLDEYLKHDKELRNTGIINKKAKYIRNGMFDWTENEETNFYKNNIERIVKELSVKDGAKEYIDKLKEDGNEIYIVTARYLTNRNTADGKKMREIVINWLEEQDIYYDEIIFSPEDKKENCKKYNIDIMIEDKVDNINKISSIIPVICFHAGYNKECNGSNIYRAYNWYDIYNLISGGKICKIK